MTELQRSILEIFKEVAKVCDNNNIPYYAIGGTCLGAVRHKGFIPWDDDIDIAIPIEYLKKFCDVARKQLPQNLYLYTPDDTLHYHQIWIKVCDNTTTFIEKSEFAYRDAYKGVFVDVMPIAGVPSDINKQKAYIKKLVRLEKLNNIRRFPVASLSKHKRIAAWLVKKIINHLPYNTFSRKYIKTLCQNKMISSELTGYTWGPGFLPRLIFPIKWFKDTVYLDFEDTKIKCPIGYDAYLTHQFGDYMQLPPENQRERHNGFVDLKKSYNEYRLTGVD